MSCRKTHLVPSITSPLREGAVIEFVGALFGAGGSVGLPPQPSPAINGDKGAIVRVPETKDVAVIPLRSRQKCWKTDHSQGS